MQVRVSVNTNMKFEYLMILPKGFCFDMFVEMLILGFVFKKRVGSGLYI